MKKEKFVIIDGNALIHRAWHAIPPLKTKDGILINAAYGFTSILLKAIKDLRPDYLALTFDMAGPTSRHKIYQAYKANRQKQPDELYEQFSIIHKVVDALKIPYFQKKGIEADDIIGTLSSRKDINQKGIEVIIVTGDKDTFQLIDENVEVYTLRKGISDTVIYDVESIRDRYGLEPQQLIDMKSLAGDPSDNIKGVKGIGEVYAVKLISSFGSLENLYKQLELNPKSDKWSFFSERIKKLLVGGKEDAFLGKDLVTIMKDIDIDFNLEDCRMGHYNRQEVLEVFGRYEFKTLVSKLPDIKAPAAQRSLFADDPVSKSEDNPKFDYHLIKTKEEFDVFFKEMKRHQRICIDTETDSLDMINASLLGMSFSWKPKQAYYVHLNLGGDILNMEQQYKMENLKKVLVDDKYKKFGHNIKFDYKVLAKYGIKMQGITFDTMLASYLLDSGSRAHKLDDIVLSEFGYQMIPISRLIGSGKDCRSLKDLPAEEVFYYACEDADFCFRLVRIFKERLVEKEQKKLFDKIEIPLIPVLAAMELHGVKLDIEFLKKFSTKVHKELAKVEIKIYELSGENFNINSSLQLKKILFDKLGISSQGLKKIKTGISIAAGELDKIYDKHLIIKEIIKYRELNKLLTTYADALPQLVNPTTDRLHTNFNQMVTATGRLSSSEPNLQNIPIRTDLGREIRKSFVAEEGYTLLSADYSQIELRVIASLAGDENMIRSFVAGEDIHVITASLINDVLVSEVTAQMRRAAKAINFGIIYGQGAFALGRSTGMSFAQAKNFIDKYFQVRQKVKQYLEQTKEDARQKGFVKTLYGRVRYLPDINSKISSLRAAAERMAVNMPVQGTAADLVKIAMINIDKEIKKNFSNDVAMVLQVHDDLVFEVKKTALDDFALTLKAVMEGAGKNKIKVPITVEMKQGPNWLEMEKI